MSDTLITSESIEVKEKPAQVPENAIFPPFPEPTKDDFEDDISEEERDFYKSQFSDLTLVKTKRLHCTACDRHLGCSARNESRMRIHPLLRTLICQTCLTFYNSGEFDKGDDGSELYCRWCGQGGQVYCCANCPHVFCAKCIKRNLGIQKIKEIEELDDWKCFKCNPKSLWNLRSLCWAVLRYCDLRIKITHLTEDPVLKEKYQKDCAQDDSMCCKRKSKVKEKEVKKKEEATARKSTTSVLTKIPPTIQVRKFASINIEDNAKEKKAQKRPISPKQYSKPVNVKSVIPIAPKAVNPLNVLNKRIKICGPPIMNPIRFNTEKKPMQVFGNYIRPQRVVAPTMYNGGTYTMPHDNINLSLESLTQGLDMSAVAAMNNATQDDDVVCTPDFPMEPLCEVSEDNNDDDVQCITPAPKPPQPSSASHGLIVGPPPLVPRVSKTLPELSPDNIVQMTDSDVTVNSATGGLKFRVDPQTLSSNKMYRLPDGRIFAINSNPNMPGGYSATIIAVTDNTPGKATLKGATYAAKLSAVSTKTSTSSSKISLRPQVSRNKNTKRNSVPHASKANKAIETRNSLIKDSSKENSTERPSRTCDLNSPVEWYRYNLIDAIDSLEYSLSRLQQLKQEATTVYLRTRTIQEMRGLHRSLDRLLNMSANRFTEIRENLNKELMHYIKKKQESSISDDDDDVEILPDGDNNDDPISIDENSMESNDDREVDLTGAASSEHDSSGKSLDKNFAQFITNDDCYSLHNKTDTENNTIDDDIIIHDNENSVMEIDGTCENLNETDLINEEEKNNEQSNSKSTNNEEKVEAEKDSTVKSTILYNAITKSVSPKLDPEENSIENTTQINEEESADIAKEVNISEINNEKATVEEIKQEENGIEEIEETNNCTDNDQEKTDGNQMSENTLVDLLKDIKENITSLNSHTSEQQSDNSPVKLENNTTNDNE